MTNNTTEHREELISIVIIEDDETIRNGYAYLLNNVESFHVENTFASYEDAETSIATIAPGIILLDIQLHGISGIEALHKLKQLTPSSVIIMLTVHEDPEFIFNALSNGAAGYLTKNTAHGKIIEAIKDAVHGGGPLSAAVARVVIQSFQKNQNSPLTKRENEVLQSIADGKSRGRISEEFFIDVETVKTHIKNIYLKLNVHNRADAIRIARDNRYIR